jgi:hypothetical protein
MQPWYQPVLVQSAPTSKLSYQKFQYPAYVRDVDSDAHIKNFKNVIRANGETMEVDIINMFGFTL